MISQMFVSAFYGLRDLARASPWPTGISLVALLVCFAISCSRALDPKSHKAQLWLKIRAKIWFEKPKPIPCSNCAPYAAETYCVECKKVFCKFCCCLLHHPGMKTEKHSIEALVSTEQGVQILSHLLPNFLTCTIVMVFMYMVTRPSDTQILGASYCPVIQRTRQSLVQWDPSIFYYWKASFAQFCDFEDSAWRLYIDAWFRAVVTHTDSLFLVLVAFVKAFLFEKYIELVLARIMGIFYALLAILVRHLECYIPSSLHYLEGIAKSISFNKLFKPTGKAPPPTFWRKRPKQNWLEGWKYALDRQTRLFSYYQGHAQGILVAVLRASLYGAVAIRLACIFFSADHYLRMVFSALGLGPLMKREQNMFLGLTGMVEEPTSHQPYYSEWLLTSSFMHIFAHHGVHNSVLEVSGSLFEGLRAAIWPVARTLFIPGLVAGVLRIIYTKTINKQNAYFLRQWPETRLEIFGSCNRENLVDWKNASFRRMNASSE